MSDIISRQAAIDLAKDICVPTKDGSIYRHRCIDPDEIRELPSAQLEIVRCKDCKYGDTFHEFDEPDMPMKCLGQHYGGTYPDDFCSYAERREDD